MEVNEMKHRLAITVIGLLFLALAGGLAHLQSIPFAHAQDQLGAVTDRVSYASSGLPTGHTMRVYVTNLMPPPSNDLPPGPIRALINFGDPAGRLVRNARTGEVIRRVVTLDTGESGFADLDGDLLPPGPTRYQVRPVVTIQYALGVVPPDGPSEHKPFVTAVEIFNNTNPKAFVALGGNPAVVRGFNPQPDPPTEP